jgi:hypothetical protein
LVLFGFGVLPAANAETNYPTVVQVKPNWLALILLFVPAWQTDDP